MTPSESADRRRSQAAASERRRRRTDIGGPDYRDELQRHAERLRRCAELIADDPSLPDAEVFEISGMDPGSVEASAFVFWARMNAGAAFNIVTGEWSRVDVPAESGTISNSEMNEAQSDSSGMVEGLTVSPDSLLSEDPERAAERLAVAIAQSGAIREALDQYDQDVAHAARVAGATWSQIAEKLGISTSQAHRRYEPGAKERAHRSTADWYRRKGLRN